MEIEKERSEGAAPVGEAWWQSWKAGWRAQPLSEVDRALCEYAERLTHDPASMREHHLEALRGLGLTDVALHDAIQVIAYFNYINRIADAVHVDLEADMEPYPDE